MVLEEETVDLAAELDSCLSMMSGRFHQARVGLEQDIDPRCPGCAANRPGIKQMVTNLLCNAAKFTPSGGNVRSRHALATVNSPLR